MQRVRSKRSRERSTRGQVVANIEPPPPPPATYHEEDESGGFETYRGNPHRRISSLNEHSLRADHETDNRRFSDTRLVKEDTLAAEEARVYHITVDPLELNIREMLALDARREARTARSLPNLRASRESLLPPATPAPPLPPS